MDLFRRKAGSRKGGVNAPSYDPYNRFGNSQNGLFGFRKDRHVIMPGVTSYEENRLISVKNYVEKETGKPCTLSQELINDVYSIYVNDDIKRRPEADNNTVRHQILDKVYDSLTKVVTVDSPLYTQMLTRELALALQKIDDEIREEQKQKKDGSKGSEGLESQAPGKGEGEGNEGENEDGDGDNDDDGDGDGDGNNGSNTDSAGKGDGSAQRDVFDKMIKDALDNNQSQIEEAKSNADKKIKDLKNQLGSEAIKDLSEKSPDFLDKMDELKQALKGITINKDSVKKVMEKILNESMNYFSTKFSRVEESLFDCEECEDLFGLEFLHPVFKNAQIMDVGNETRIYKGKIDLYLDCSGSMDSKRDFEGTRLRMIDLVKGIAMVLYRMGMIENLYFFDTSLYKIEDINEISILTFDQSGGTDFEKVVSEIKRNGNNSVIITDGYDSCSQYTKQAFWVGVGGTTFNSGYSDSSFPIYQNNNQCVAYKDNGNLEYCK